MFFSVTVCLDVSIERHDQRAKRGILTCKQADPIAEQFLKQLKFAGGAPEIIAAEIRPEPAGGAIRFHLLRPR